MVKINQHQRAFRRTSGGVSLKLEQRHLLQTKGSEQKKRVLEVLALWDQVDQEIIGGWIRRKASVLAALLFSCANYFYKKAKQYFSPCPKLPRLETLWENLETRWIRNTAYLFCKSCFARRESKGGGVSPLLSALLIYPLSISWKVFFSRKIPDTRFINQDGQLGQHA